MFGEVICLSHLRWGFVYQRPNHLMSCCARDRRVFFVEEPILGAEAPRLEVSLVDKGVHVAVPHLPHGVSGEAAKAMQRHLLQELVDRSRIRDPLLWFYTPMALGYARDLRASGVVYDCMDELSHFRGAPPELRERERELFTIADVVFTGGQSLYEVKRHHHPRVHAFPSSVDAPHFHRARSPMPEPHDQRSLRRPRLGFFGVIDERMDLELVERVAESRPYWELVFVGPIAKIDPAHLPRRANIHYLGQKSYDELPHYLAGWDVAVMPFARNDATKFISPTKTLEFLAAGKPIVSTAIRDVVRPYGDRGLVRIANEPSSFVSAVEAALAERGTPAERARHDNGDVVLAQTSWGRTWSRMQSAVHHALSSRTRAEVEKEGAPCSTT
jgi:glycosyltransferase involved in cell wall biosynthesis